MNGAREGCVLKDRITDIIVYIIAASAYCFVCLYLPYAYPKLPDGYFRSFEVVIPSGASAGAAARLLEEAGVVDDAGALVREMARSGLDRKIKPGLYTLHRSTPRGAVKQLEKAKPVVERAALIPGSRFDRLAALFAEEGVTAADFYSAMAKAENFCEPVRKWLPEDVRARMVFLLPETYFIAPGPAVADGFIASASRLWFERVGKDIPEDTSANDVLMRGVLASVVEGEARVAEERPILAGIFLKRIEKKMRLQSCATVIYCWAERGEKKTALTYKDLEIDSPYNTYRNDGLPPGPICVPSESSWKSALAPQETEYLFFFADGRGRHIFSRTYGEHIAKQRGMTR